MTLGVEILVATGCFLLYALIMQILFETEWTTFEYFKLFGVFMFGWFVVGNILIYLLK